MGRPFQARIGANESVFGPSPSAIAAMRDAAPDTWKYSDPENHDLNVALARHHGVAPENIIVGEGADALLGYLVRMIVVEGTPVVTSQGAYPTFNYHVAGFGGRFELVPYRDDREDTQALIARARETAAPLIYLANPDNPMGSWSDAATVQRMIDAVPDGAASLPRRGLSGIRAGRHRAAARRGKPARPALADLLQGLRHGGRAGRLRHRA